MRTETIDIEALRRSTPGCRHVTHLNNAGASLMPQQVLDAMTGYLRLEAEQGGYEAEYRNRERIDGVRASIAAMIGGQADEVALLDSATRAWDTALESVPLRAGDRILTSPLEYMSNWIALRHIALRSGARVEVVPNRPDGCIDLSALAGMLDDRVRIVCLTHVPTHRGTVNPAAEVGRLARSVGALYLLDACQSVGQLPVDTSAIGCHMLSGSGRKYLRGPRGTGFLWVDPGIVEQLTPSSVDIVGARVTGGGGVTLHPDARRFEQWEGNRAAQIGLGVAVDLVRELGIDSITSEIGALATRLRASLLSVADVTVHEAGGSPSGIVTFSIAGHDPGVVRERAWARGINVWVSEAGNEMLAPSGDRVGDVVRASVHYYNTPAECDRLTDLVSEMARE